MLFRCFATFFLLFCLVGNVSNAFASVFVGLPQNINLTEEQAKLRQSCNWRESVACLKLSQDFFDDYLQTGLVCSYKLAISAASAARRFNAPENQGVLMEATLLRLAYEYEIDITSLYAEQEVIDNLITKLLEPLVNQNNLKARHELGLFYLRKSLNNLEEMNTLQRAKLRLVARESSNQNSNILLTSKVKDHRFKEQEQLLDKSLQMLKKNCQEGYYASCDALGDYHFDFAQMELDSKSILFKQDIEQNTNGITKDICLRNAISFYKQGCLSKNLNNNSNFNSLSSLKYSLLGSSYKQSNSCIKVSNATLLLSSFYEQETRLKDDCELDIASSCVALSRVIEKQGKSQEPYILKLQEHCVKGYSDACFRVAYLHQRARDLRQADIYLEQACNLHNAAACFYLGIREDSHGHEDIGYKFFKKACKLGSGRACLAISNKNRDNNTMQHKYRKIACTHGHALSCYTLASQYAKSFDDEQAFHYDRMACLLNDADSCYRLGLKYLNGKGTKTSYAKAQKAYQKACLFGLKKGCRHISTKYFD